MDYPSAELGLAEGLRYADEIEQSYCRHVHGGDLGARRVGRRPLGRGRSSVRGDRARRARQPARHARLARRPRPSWRSGAAWSIEARSLLDESLAISRPSGEVRADPAGAVGTRRDRARGRRTGTRAGALRGGLEVARQTGEQPAAGAVHRHRRASGPRGSSARCRRAMARARDAAPRRLVGRLPAPRSPMPRGSSGWRRARWSPPVKPSRRPSPGGTSAAASGRRRWARLDLAGCLLRIEPLRRGRDAPREARETAGATRTAGRSWRASTSCPGLASRHGSFDEPWRPLTSPRVRGRAAHRRRPDERGDRDRAVDRPEDGQRPCRAHPREARRRPASRDRDLGRHRRATGHDRRSVARRPRRHALTGRRAPASTQKDAGPAIGPASRCRT